MMLSMPARRAFVSKIFPEVKKHNPSLPILIREAAGVPPRAIARGRESSALDVLPSPSTLGPPRTLADPASRAPTASGYERQTDLANASSAEDVEKRIAALLQDAKFKDA
jgi:hypothetical protein